MPRRKARSEFELAGQWIAEEPGRPGHYRFWIDPGVGRTRRASLGTTDIEEAKARLAAAALAHAKVHTDFIYNEGASLLRRSTPGLCGYWHWPRSPTEIPQSGEKLRPVPLKSLI